MSENELGLAEALNYALNQWAMYADGDRGPRPDFDFAYITESTDGGDAEAQMFNKCRAALSRTEPAKETS